jgi:hypothetical protein
MPLSFVLDENLRGPLWKAIEGHNSRGFNTLDVVRVGDLPDLPLGSADLEILIWAERESRVLVTEDRKTMARRLADHLSAGRHSPGIFSTRALAPPLPIVAFLEAAAYASEPIEWQDRIEYVS